MLDKAEKTASLETAGWTHKFSNSSFIPNKSNTLRETNTPKWTAGATLAPKSSHTDSIRKEVLSILNKLTAENFDQQGEKLLSLDISAPSLYVIAQLIYQKAINEPKFTSLYAQLCLKLCGSAPNFETVGTQSIFLIKFCEDEFRARDVACDDQVSRQKCLGNLRFIAELGIRGVMPEKILHGCVQELLSSRVQHSSVNGSEVYSSTQEKNKTAETTKEKSLSVDLECLCQFLTAVGKYMDTPKAKKLMDQYFQRLRRILSRTCDSSAVTSNKYENISTEGTVCPKATKWSSASLSARVRFMVEDLMDLRENNWIPRRAGQRTETNKPRLLRDIRLEILKESGILVAPTPSERSAAQPDVPGSAFMNHSSRSSNSSVSSEFPFVGGLGSNSLKNDNGEARSWMELARMGEELCRQSSRDLCLLDNGNRSTDGPTVPFHGRLHTTRRFASSKNELPNSKSVQRQSTKTNNTDSWAAKIEKPEGSSDVGWVRGVNARLRNTAATPSNGVPTPNANLPPRMLRKLAAEAAGNPPVSSTTNAYNETKHSTHIDVHSSHANIISGNSTTVSRNGPSHITPILHSFGQSHSSNLFDENPVVTSDEKFGSQKLVWPTFSKCTANSTAYGNTQSTLTSIPQSFNSSALRTLDQPNLQNARSLAANKCHQRIEQVRPSSTNCSSPPLNHVAENHLTPPHAPDDKKIAAKLLELLVELKDPVSIKNHLNLSNVGRITIEVLAIVVLHLCEEGTNLKLAKAEPFELAELLVACAENLLCRDASVCNSKDSRKPKSVKSLGGSGHPLALVWSHLLNKLLCVTQLIYSKSKIASISAALIWNRHMDLSEFAEPLRGGKHHPLFLLVLQKLSQMVDNDCNSNKKESVCIDGATVDERRCSLIQLFQDTGLQINQMVPEGSRTNEALLALLEERDLDFLVPSLRLSIELSNLTRNISDMEGKNPQESDKHFASRLDEYLSKQPATSVGIRNSDYAHACLPVVYEYIYKVGVVELGSSSSPSTLMTRERAAWKCIVPKGLADILRNSVERQMDALHALQLFWVDKSMPKGFLFRCFMNLYDCELVCENAFLSWKEEVNPSYPEKGQALFEVNRWLTWLETAEEEDDEGQSISDSNEEHTKSVEEVAMHLENLSTACSQETKSMDHISEMVSDIIPPVLHSSSAALGSS